MMITLRHSFAAGIALAVFVLTAGSAAAGATIKVPGDVATIQDAINLAQAGDTVLVGDGTYVENINFMGKAITVSSVNGAAVTTIDGAGSGSVVTFTSGETAASILRGFTIRNGKADDGGGVQIRGASPMVQDNVIIKNLGSFGGGGVAVFGGAPLIERNLITQNQAISGNGLELAFTDAVVRSNTISLNTRFCCSGGIGGGGISVRGAGNAQIIGNLIGENTTTADGGGISLFAAGTPTIQNNIIRDNKAGSGGGISHANVSDSLIVQNLIVGNSAGEGGGIDWLVPSGSRGPLLFNNTIALNDSASGSGLFADGFDMNSKLINNIIFALPGETAVLVGSFNDQNAPLFFNNDLFSLGGTAYSGIGSDPTGSNGNVSLDALFVDAAAGDFHLLPTSGLIDIGDNLGTGLPLLDLDGRPRVFDGDGNGVAIVDLGAFELVVSAPVVPAPSTALLLMCGALVLGLVARRC